MSTLEQTAITLTLDPEGVAETVLRAGAAGACAERWRGRISAK